MGKVRVRDLYEAEERAACHPRETVEGAQLVSVRGEQQRVTRREGPDELGVISEAQVRRVCTVAKGQHGGRGMVRSR